MSLTKHETENVLIFLFYEQVMDKNGMNPVKKSLLENSHILNICNSLQTYT